MTGSHPEWFVYEILSKKRVAIQFPAQSRRVSEGPPSSYALQSSLGDGYGYQFAARASPLLFLRLSIWLMPTASRANNVMLTELATQASEARDRQVTQGSAEPLSSDSHSPPQVWGFHSVYDNVAGSLVFGLVVNAPDEPFLSRVASAGSAPGAGEVHLVFPAGCFPRAAEDKFFFIQAAAGGRGS